MPFRGRFLPSHSTLQPAMGNPIANPKKARPMKTLVVVTIAESDRARNVNRDGIGIAAVQTVGGDRGKAVVAVGKTQAGAGKDGISIPAGGVAVGRHAGGRTATRARYRERSAAGDGG